MLRCEHPSPIPRDNLCIFSVDAIGSKLAADNLMVVTGHHSDDVWLLCLPSATGDLNNWVKLKSELANGSLAGVPALRTKS